MSFVYPQFLYALAVISIPIIIHLFNFRRFRTVYFSDIRFLKEIKQQTRNRNRLKHLLVLLMRILAFTFLVMAFAQPYIQIGSKEAGAGMQAVGIYIDNSFSMENVGKNGDLFGEAKNSAREIALSYSQTDQFQLLSNDFEGKHQHLVNRDEFLTMLGELKISPTVRSVSEVIAREYDALQKSDSKRKKTFLISDFQKSIADFEKIKNDTAIRTILLLVAANKQNNLFIDSCWFYSPVHQVGKEDKLFVRIKNLSNEDIENVPLKLYLNNQLRTPSSFSIHANETKEVALTFTIKEFGIQQGWVELTDYPVTYDDNFYFSFNVDKNIPVMCITSTTAVGNTGDGIKALRSLFGKDSSFAFSVMDANKMDYSLLPEQQLVVLNELPTISSGLAQELTRFTENGGSLVVFPSVSPDTSSYKAFLSAMGLNYYLKRDTSRTKVSWINFQNEIFADVFDSKGESSKMKNENINLPFVYSYFAETRLNRTTEEILLKLQNGSPLFSKYTYRKGSVYLSAVPLNTDWSNLIKHAIFVPLLYKIAISAAPSSGLSYLIGINNSIPVKTKLTGENIYKLQGEPGTNSANFEIIPESRVVDQQPTIFIHDQIREAGNYRLFAGNHEVAGLSFNFNRKESDLARYSMSDLNSVIEKDNLHNFSSIDADNKNITKVLADLSQGIKLWKWCIVLVLFFLAAETALLRLWK